MMRHRSGPLPDPSSSSEEEDVFSALSRKRKGSKSTISDSSSIKKKANRSVIPGEKLDDSKEDAQPPAKVAAVVNTSSTKRHHGEVSDARKAKMDALLLELETEKKRAATEQPRSRAAPDRNHQARGSFVDPGDELLTTNIFVGNLATSITEEQMTDLFRQFGEHFWISLCLYRVKRV